MFMHTLVSCAIEIHREMEVYQLQEELWRKRLQILKENLKGGGFLFPEITD